MAAGEDALCYASTHDFSGADSDVDPVRLGVSEATDYYSCHVWTHLGDHDQLPLVQLFELSILVVVLHFIHARCSRWGRLGVGGCGASTSRLVSWGCGPVAGRSACHIVIGGMGLKDG